MTDDPLITIDELAALLRVPVEMAREWEKQAILPIEDDAEVANSNEATDPNETAGSDKKYRQRKVVLALRAHPEIMTVIKQAMMAKRGIFNEPAEDTGT